MYLSEKSIHDITNFDYTSNSRSRKKKKKTTKNKKKQTWRNNIIYRLLQGLWLHTQREDGANTPHLRPTQRNRRSDNDAV